MIDPFPALEFNYLTLAQFVWKNMPVFEDASEIERKWVIHDFFASNIFIRVQGSVRRTFFNIFPLLGHFFNKFLPCLDKSISMTHPWGVECRVMPQNVSN